MSVLDALLTAWWIAAPVVGLLGLALGARTVARATRRALTPPTREVPDDH